MGQEKIRFREHLLAVASLLLENSVLTDSLFSSKQGSCPFSEQRFLAHI